MPFVSNNRRRLGEAGVTSMEVAITFGLFITLVFTVIDLSRYFFSQQALTTLVTATARLGYAGGNTGILFGQNQPSVQTLVANYAPLLDATQITNFTWPPPETGVALPNGQTTATGIEVFTVSATYSFTPLTPFFGALVIPMTATVTYQY